MAPRPLVSIVMPCYNAMAWLEDALKSIFAQTLADWELVAVDDASTDGTWEYLQRVHDPRVRVARNERNRKQAFTQNRGIQMARGKYVARMDADDLCMPERLARQVEMLEANPEIDVLGCGIYKIDEDLRIIAVTHPPTTHAEIARRPSLKIRLCHGALVGKTEWFRTWQADPTVKLAQDFDFLFRSHLSSTFGNVADPLYVYREGGVTMAYRRKCLAIYYRCRSLWQNGFKMGIPFTTLYGIGCHLPMPAIRGVKILVGSKTSMLPRSGNGKPTPAEQEVLANGLRIVAATEVPLRADGG